MAKLTKKDILHVAKLSYLKLGDAEVDKFTDQLSRIVDHISQLTEVNTDGIDPTNQTTGLVNITRDDEINPSRIFSAKEATLNAHKTNGTYFQVSAILDKNKNE